MAQTHKMKGVAYGICDRCGNAFALRSRGQPYKFCSRACSVVPVEQRFAANVDCSAECWIWTVKKNDDGYGELQVGKRIVKAHRLAYEINIGAIPDGLEVCHSCDNPSCVRPSHLFVGTHTDNMRDMAKKNRGVYPCMKGEEHGESKLSNGQILSIRRDSRAQRRIASEYGVSQSLISMIKTRRVWAHL